MTKFVKYLFILLIIFAASARGEKRPAYFEFAPAYPKEVKPFVKGEHIPRRFDEFIVYDTLYLDKKGKIDAITFADTTLYRYNEYIVAYLNELEFEPAKFKGKKIASKLPLKVHYRPGIFNSITYPVSDSLAITDRDLFFDACRANEVLPPEIIEFPSFYCDLAKTDTLIGYPYIVVKVEIDSSGRAYNMELDRSTYPSFEHHIQFASLYAKYQPAQIRGKKVKSTAYILVRFFEDMPFPTRVWRPADIDSMYYYEKHIVELIPEKIGRLSDPIVRHPNADKMLKTNFSLPANKNLACWIMIDDYGQMYVRRISSGAGKKVARIKETIQKTPFYPALDFDGNIVPAEGLVAITHFDESYVRIDYIW